VDWVLSTPPLEDRRAILDLLPSLVTCAAEWLEHGVEVAMNRCNAAPEPPAGG
jgi:hypothetical protein